MEGSTLRAAPRVSRVPPVRVSFVPHVRASKVVAVAPSKSGSRYRVAAPRRVDLAAGRARARDGPKVAKLDGPKVAKLEPSVSRPKAQVLPEGDVRSDASCVEALRDPLAFDTHAGVLCTQRTGAGQSGVLCNPCRELFLQRTLNTEQFSARWGGAENCFCRELQTQNTALEKYKRLRKV